jgi:hypothetical protein
VSHRLNKLALSLLPHYDLVLPAQGMATITIDTGSSGTLEIQEHMLVGGVSQNPNLPPGTLAWK